MLEFKLGQRWYFDDGYNEVLFEVIEVYGAPVDARFKALHIYAGYKYRLLKGYWTDKETTEREAPFWFYLEGQDKPV